MEMIKTIIDRVQSGQSNQKNVFDSVVGKLKTNERRWIVDIDTKDWMSVLAIKQFIDKCRPVGDKTETIIPTKSGYHLITKKFDVMEFKKYYPEIDIAKKNPTLLFFPNSLEN
jgi:hypothetical protein